MIYSAWLVYRELRKKTSVSLKVKQRFKQFITTATHAPSYTKRGSVSVIGCNPVRC